DPGRTDWADRLLPLLPAVGRVELVTNDAAKIDPLRTAAEARGLSVRVTSPRKGAKRQLLDICGRNLEYRTLLPPYSD
ncbi:hypothetical protein DF947_22060, partial [Pedobacter paludis]